MKATEKVQKHYELEAACVDCDKVRQNAKNSFCPKKIEIQLINVNFSYLETFNRDRAVPHAVGFYRVSKILDKFDRDLTNDDIEKNKSNTVVMENEDCMSQTFDNLKM